MARINIVNADNKIESNPRRAYFQLKNTGGPKGDTGAQGPQGPKGDTGAQGPAGLSASVTVGSTTTLAPGASATVTNSGDTRNAVLNFGIPTGAQGPQGVQGPKGDTGPEGAKGAKGDTGAAATVTVNATNTGAPGTNAEVQNLGDEHNAVLQFTIPRGDKGETGATGATGAQGEPGDSFTPTVVTSLPETGDPSAIYFTEKAHTTQTATGNHITATITDEAGKMESFQLDGDTFQQSYTGKNLLNIDAATVKADRGITATIPKDGTITLTGTAISTGNAVVTERYDFAQAWPAGAYTFSIQQPLTRQFYIHFTLADNSTQNIILTAGQTSASGTFTQALKAYDLRFNVTSGESYNETTTLMVEAGEEATSYEPYVGGIPSPNPDYPQPIQTVTGTQTVEIVGKNIFDKASLVIGSLQGDGSVTGALPEYQTSGFMRVIAGETYYKTTSGSARLKFFNSNKEPLTNVYDDIANASNAQAFTPPENAAYMRLTVTATYADTLQIELGSTATAYTPCYKQTLPLDLGTTELCKLGTYQDYIWKDGEEWKVHKAVEKASFDGSGSWFKSGNTSATNFVAALRIDNAEPYILTPISSVGSAIMPAFTNLPIVSDLKVSQGFRMYNGSTNAQNIALSFDINEVEDLTDAIAWIAANKPVIYYPLSTPTETTITDAALIAQLEAIRTALLQNGANTITNTATSPNLAGDMEIGYYGYTPSSQYDKWIWLNVGAAGAHYEQL